MILGAIYQALMAENAEIAAMIMLDNEVRLFMQGVRLKFKQ
jgi:hypothetical protein